MIIKAGDDEFDWSLEDSLPAPPQLATTIYGNAKGEIIVRQRDDGFEDGDTIIVLTARNAYAIGQALMDLAEDMGIRPDLHDGSIPNLQDGDEIEADPPPANDRDPPVPPLFAAMAARPLVEAAE